MQSLYRNLLWVDCAAGGVVGVAVIVLSGWLSHLEGLPREVLLFTGIVNLLYASFSFFLARRFNRPMGLIKLLVAANLAWVPVCLGLAVYFRDQATVLGLAHLIGEALFVGGLALAEWTQRHQLVTTF
ncbi:MAG: hypothetical protein AAGI71_13805 [Bacteroidota bacterium]